MGTDVLTRLDAVLEHADWQQLLEVPWSDLHWKLTHLQKTLFLSMSSRQAESVEQQEIWCLPARLG